VILRKQKHSLAEQAFVQMKRDILRCNFRPGSVLKEGELAVRYGMSKTPIREGLSLLRREGFIEVLPRRGILVRAIELQDVQNTYLLRMLLEPEAAALAATRATKDQLKQISEIGDALSSGHRSKLKPTEELTLHRSLHEAIAEASGIRELGSMIRTLHEKMEWFYNYERIGEPLQTTHDPHALVAAIVGGDAEQARSIIAGNIKAARQHLIDSLIKEPRERKLSLVAESA
jgi:DNA-binding GntR family transcriptional regulator